MTYQYPESTLHFLNTTANVDNSMNTIHNSNGNNKENLLPLIQKTPSSASSTILKNQELLSHANHGMDDGNKRKSQADNLKNEKNLYWDMKELFEKMFHQKKKIGAIAPSDFIATIRRENGKYLDVLIKHIII